MNRLMTVFGRRLRTLRKGRGLTQEQLGRLAQIDYKHIGGIERGKHAPSFDAIEKIVKVLKVDYQELFGPDRTFAGQLDDHLEGLLREVDGLSKAHLRRFFADLLTAVRRLKDR